MAAQRHGESDTRRRYSRWPLYVPFVVLALLAAGWSAFWFVARDRVVEALDTWVAREAALGRRWTCPNRAVTGFPFRFELICDKPTFSGLTTTGPVEGSVARVHVAAQVYDPSLVIAEAQGPLMVRVVGQTARFDWTTFQASLRGRADAFERGSLVVTGAALRLGADRAASVMASGETVEVHLRRDPGRPEADGAYELVAKLVKGSVPALDALVGGAEPADAALRATVTHGDAFGAGGRVEQLERWRSAGGEISVRLLSLTKGSRRIEGKGVLSLDEAHRPRGEMEAAAAGFEDVLRRLGGGQRGTGGLLGGGQGGIGGLLADGLEILGGRRPPQAGEAGGTKLTPLPPLRIVDGIGYLGPIPIFIVPPLY